jgi:hypothetical protein
MHKMKFTLYFLSFIIFIINFINLNDFSKKINQKNKFENW